MNTRKNKSFLILALLVALSFSMVATGGEFLHQKIHHHGSQASHDECFIYQLQSQVSIAVSTIVLALFFQVVLYLVKDVPSIFVEASCNLPPLRAPPAPLS